MIRYKSTQSLIVAIMIFTPLIMLNGQISMFGDSDGESSLQFVGGNAIILNAKETSLSLGFAPEKYDKTDLLNWSINLKAKSKKGISNIIKDDEFNLNGDLSVSFSFPLGDDLSKYVYIIPGIQFSRPNIYYEDRLVEEQVKARNNFGSSISFGYNNENFEGLVLGVSLTTGISDNSRLLKELKIQTIESSTTDETGSSTAITEKSAFNSDEYDSSHAYSRLNFDFGGQLILPQLLLLLQGNIKSDDNFGPSYNLGFGLYLGKESAPFESLGGIQLVFNDLAENRTDKSFSERISLNIVATIPLNFGK